ncbi:MAG: sigma 54-interacting transcriptional regulator [Pseudomonadota bacterium]
MNVQSKRQSARVLLVDDDTSLLRLISLRLESGGFTVDAVESADIALARIATRRPDVVVTDLRMAGMDGMTLFRQIRETSPALPVIILTAHGSIADAVAATQQGVFGFLTKPFNSRELLDVVEAAAASARPDSAESSAWREAIITRSRLMHNLLDELELIAESDASVLILGESGTGKEIIARAIHAASPRADGPFVPVNCAAMPADLLEAELFGHIKGAFTGADRDRQGLFVQADGGTLMLDEIGDMPMEFQAKLLRAVQEKAVRPVGGGREVLVDVRLLSATHRNLEQALNAGELREDLYYRLNVVRLELPPLRERPEDIPLLAEHFLTEFQACRAESKRISRFSAEAMRLLIAHRWPGNIRQLRNVVEQVSALCRKGPIPLDLVQRALRQEQGELLPLAEARTGFERDYLIRVLRMTQGNVTEAARIAGRNRTEFYRLLKRHHLESADFKQNN